MPTGESDTSVNSGQSPCPLAVIILNYRTPGMTIDCLGSLEAEIQTVHGMRVLVVDNASGDGSDEQIEQAIRQQKWSDWARLHRSPVNGGFAAGNNVGLKAIEADRYMLLNSDTIVRPGAIAEMMRAMDEHPKVGILGPRLEWPDGKPQESCFNNIRPMHALVAAARTGALSRMVPKPNIAVPVSDVPMNPDWVTFACALIRKTVIDQVGGLDAGYFMYFDDVDYGRRARQAGWDVLYWPRAHVVHLRGGSGPVKQATAERKRRPRYYYESRTRYYAKYYGTAGLWWANLLWMLGRAISWLRELVRTKHPHTCQREAMDNWTNGLSPMRESTMTSRKT